MGIIYCIHNLTTGKKYIGQTVKKLQRRVFRHFRTINETKISRAIQKYSKYNFVYGIVEEVEDTNLLDEREKYWIQYYDTVNDGFNIKEGGKCSRGFKQSQGETSGVSNPGAVTSPVALAAATYCHGTARYTAPVNAK